MNFLTLILFLTTCSLSIQQGCSMLGNSFKFKLKRQAPRPASPYSVLVTGANRGIGLALVKELLTHKDIGVIIAGVRNPAKASALKAIPDPRLHIVALDVDDDASIKKSYKEVEKIVGNRGLNVLVNNAGILLQYSTKPGGAIDRPTLMKQFNTNVFGTVVVTQVYTPLLQKAAQRMKGDSFSFSRAAVIHISSIVGSIFNNRGSEGEYAAYMGSKTAVNQFSRTFAFDLASGHILSVAFHPGFVSTDMTGHSKEAIAVEKSAKMLVNSFYKLNGKHSGRFYNPDLTPLPF